MHEKKKFLFIIVCLLCFVSGFAGGRLFDRARSSINQAGAGADVGGYDKAASRVERAAESVRGAARSVNEAAGEVRIGIGEAGNIAEIAGDIRDGTVRALDRACGIEGGIQLITRILDEAEKRNPQMEEAGGIGLD
ncbi:MAG: hypothetical protein FWB86_11890 [Treponema sp.]|nr:hypothetical protein [Treponema sp.]